LSTPHALTTFCLISSRLSISLSILSLFFCAAEWTEGGLQKETLVWEEGPCDHQYTPTDIAWLLGQSFSVLSMQAGFALLEAGSVRSTSSVNIMMKNIGDLCIGMFAYYTVGWMFAYGSEGGSFIGWSNGFMIDVYDLSGFFFQFSFAATASTIDSGAVAERMRFLPYLALSAWMTAWIYPVVSHWAWDSKGWLFEKGFVDFAGSGVVHLLGGSSAMFSCWIIGPRTGKYMAVDGSGNPSALNMFRASSFQSGDFKGMLFGTFILWIGWYGFNCGSTLALSGGKGVEASLVAVTTTAGAAGGGLAGYLHSFITMRSFDIVSVASVCTGLLAGLVSITASANIVTVWEALFIGLIGGIIALWCGDWMEKKLRIDDPVAAVAVHGFGGVWALIAVGLFANNQNCGRRDVEMLGLFHGGGFELMGVQLIGMASIIAWSIGNTALFFFVVHQMGIPLRVSLHEERLGLDHAEHGVLHSSQFVNNLNNVSQGLDDLPVEDVITVNRVVKKFLAASMLSIDSVVDNEDVLDRPLTLRMLQKLMVSGTDIDEWTELDGQAVPENQKEDSTVQLEKRGSFMHLSRPMSPPIESASVVKNPAASKKAAFQQQARSFNQQQVSKGYNSRSLRKHDSINEVVGSPLSSEGEDSSDAPLSAVQMQSMNAQPGAQTARPVQTAGGGRFAHMYSTRHAHVQNDDNDSVSSSDLSELSSSSDPDELGMSTAATTTASVERFKNMYSPRRM
jgi:Amt family ammonium transporter